MTASLPKVILIRRSLGGPGGAERVFKKYQAALAEECEVIPVSEPAGAKGGSAARAVAFARWADEQIAAHPGAVSISLERGPRAQVYRAGDGVHKHYRKLMGGWSLNPIHWVYPRLDKQSLEAAEVVVANSKMVAEEIRRYYPQAAKKVRVIYNGIDMKRFSPVSTLEEKLAARIKLKLPVEGALFLFMANGWRRKGLAQALEIVKRCPALAPQLVIVGKGNPGKLRGKPVIYRAVVDQMPDYYRACDAFILPTRYDPFTSSVVEALACGLPVVTTSQNGAAEVVRHQVTGYVLPQAKKELAQAAAWLEANVRKLEPAAVAQTVQDYTVEREVAALRKIFLGLKGRSV